MPSGSVWASSCRLPTSEDDREPTALAGSLPGTLLYALTGTVAASRQDGALIFLLTFFAAGVFWLLGRWLESHLTKPEGGRVSGQAKGVSRR